MQHENKSLSLRNCSTVDIIQSYPNAHWTLHVAITTNVTTPHGSLYFRERRKAELTLQSILSSTDICKAPVAAFILRGIEWVEPWRALHGRLHLTGRAVRRRSTWPIHLSGIGLNQEKSHTMRSRIALHCCCICLFGVFFFSTYDQQHRLHIF